MGLMAKAEYKEGPEAREKFWAAPRSEIWMRSEK
jgi:hypothetical protein